MRVIQFKGHLVYVLTAVLAILSLYVVIPGPIVHAATGKHLVMVGGALKDTNESVYNKIISLAGGKGVARIGVITAASIPESLDPDAGTSKASNSVANGTYYADLFRKTYGAADAQWIPIDLDHISNASSQSVVSQVNGLSGFFFGGGDQSRLITCLEKSDRSDTPVLAAIRAKYANGAVISGSSAGTEIESGPPMLTGGESYEAVQNGSFSSIDSNHPDNLSYDSRGGFNFFTYGLLDAHFSQRGRQGRLMRLGSDRNVTMGYGVDEDTALVVDNADTAQAQMSVLGSGGVTIVDLSKAHLGSGSDWSLYGANVSYLTVGDSYNPTTKKAAIASWKNALAGHEKFRSPMRPPDDIFSSASNKNSSGGRSNPLQFVDVATDLFNSSGATSNYGTTYESRPVYEVQMTKSSSAGSAGYLGTQSGTDYVSYVNLQVDIFPY